MKPLPKPQNCAELINFISMLASLPPQTRISLRSNVNRFCKIVGRPAASIPLHVETIRSLMSTASPGAYDVTYTNWQKIRSGVWCSVELAGVQVVRCTGLSLTPEISELLKPVPPFPHHAALSPLLKFLVDTQISPWTLGQEHVPAYRDWLKKKYTRTHWPRAFKRSLAAWRKCQKLYPAHWPNSRINAEFETHHWSYPWSEMPDLEAETNRHLADLRMPRSRRLGGNRQTMRESTIKARKGYIRRAASAAARQLELKPNEINSLERLTQPDVVEALVDFQVGLLGVEQSGNIAQMLRHLNAIARHWVKRPKSDLDELRNIRRGVLLAPGPSEKNRKLLEKFRNPELRSRFVDLPEKIIKKLLRNKELSSADCDLGMLAFLCALLTKVPLRISEVMVLEFGKTLHDSGQGSSRQVIIDIPAELVKNSVPRQLKLGPKLVRSFDLYLKHFRPGLAPSTNPFLFPRGAERARSADHTSRGIATLMARELGVRMTAHQWRHVVGYIFIIENPGCYETVRRFLGHRSVQTTIAYYAFMLEDDANEALDRTIDSLAEKATQQHHRRGRRH